MAEFELDPQLDRDCHLIGDLGICRVLLMDDARWPWLVLVPRRDGAREVFDLDDGDRTLLMREVSQVGQAFMHFTGGHKLNVAALGNAVSQLHVHLVSRRTDDVNWPNVVWGLFPRQQYDAGVLRDLIPQLAAKFGLPEPD